MCSIFILYDCIISHICFINIIVWHVNEPPKSCIRYNIRIFSTYFDVGFEAYIQCFERCDVYLILLWFYFDLFLYVASILRDSINANVWIYRWIEILHEFNLSHLSQYGILVWLWVLNIYQWSIMKITIVLMPCIVWISILCGLLWNNFDLHRVTKCIISVQYWLIQCLLCKHRLNTDVSQAM